MIRLHEAELTSVLPPYIKEDPDIQAISYSFKMAFVKLLQYARMASLYADIDILPENILDLLGLELQSQYYDETMGVDVKRGIIKHSLAWYTRGGTVSAVNEMVQTVFGEGRTVEWYEFGGVPGTFYIDTNTELSKDTVKQFNDIIDKVKNKRSHLINVRVNRKIQEDIYIASHNRKTPHAIIKDSGLNNVEQITYVGTKTIRHIHTIINEKGGNTNVS
ncbi:MAG: phage tail protein I [Hungatella sp.]